MFQASGVNCMRALGAPCSLETFIREIVKNGIFYYFLVKFIKEIVQNGIFYYFLVKHAARPRRVQSSWFNHWETVFEKNTTTYHKVFSSLFSYTYGRLRRHCPHTTGSRFKETGDCSHYDTSIVASWARYEKWGFGDCCNSLQDWGYWGQRPRQSEHDGRCD